MNGLRPVPVLTEFDYEQQVWKTGEEARLLRVQHLKEELQILEGPRGGEFLVFTRKKGDPVMSLEEAKTKLKTLLQEIE